MDKQTTPTELPTRFAPASFDGLQAKVTRLHVPNFRYPVFEVAISDRGPVVDRFEVFRDAVGWVVWNAGWASEKARSARTEFAESLPAGLFDSLPQYTVAY